ncbi:MFS transporter [Neobacillus mesonae]|uniref:MFS transporter n=1 Tax=Neobacillus mesonae TaxID=1193713 RepID=UPI0020422D0C|nr:MFS transporter [Neobacillus mesonae]MCM3571379.1 MFS transporter [Neobacillus mesonae]
MNIYNAITASKRSHIRYYVVFMLFLVTALNYADRSILSISGTQISSDLGINTVGMGYIFSAFGWAYVAGQIPGGWLLDRFGSKIIYVTTIFLWSLLLLLHIITDYFTPAIAVGVLFLLRFFVGLTAAPMFPANARVVSAWFPLAERGSATAVFVSAQHFSTVLFVPLMGWITFMYGWKFVFLLIGIIGIMIGFIWVKTIYDPAQHPRISMAELAYIERGGALVHSDQEKLQKNEKGYIKLLLKNRMIIGIYLAQYFAATISYFFLTWFPIYLVTERGMSILKVGFIAVIPAFCGFLGTMLGGFLSDILLKKGLSLTSARKIPIIIGMVLCLSMVTSNYLQSDFWIVFFMALAFFGRGFGGLGWAIVADTSPKEAAGTNGALFNSFGNIAGITTPIIIGYILDITGSFNGVLIYVGSNALIAIICYLFIVGKIKRIAV